MLQVGWMEVSCRAREPFQAIDTCALFVQDVRQLKTPAHTMIEYIFFETPLRDAFVVYAEEQRVSCTLLDDNMGFVVAVPEDIGDELEDMLEERYEELERQQSNMLAAVEGGLSQLAGIRFNLPDGQSRLVPLDPAVANRLLAAFSLEEVQQLFETVARTTVNRAEDHLCKILAEEKARAAK